MQMSFIYCILLLPAKPSPMKKIILISMTLQATSSLFSQPTLTSFNPTTGSVGTSVIISGSNYNATASLNTVYFGATKALVTNATVNSLTVTVPYGANNLPISVLNTANGLTAYSNQLFETNFLCPSTLIDSSFAPKVDFVTNQNTGVVIGDFDGDGKSDMAVSMTTGASNGTVSVFRNNSVVGNINNSSFAPKQDFISINPTALAMADMDGDGKLDLISCSYSNNDVTVLKNTSTVGSISFSTPYTVSLGASGPVGIAVDDLDSDGKPEIVVADNFPGNISIIKNNSTQSGLSFAASVNFTATSQPYTPVIVDIDGDGKKEIAVANTFSGISIYKNTTSFGIINAASFATPVNFTSSINPASLAYADVDGDSKMDLITSGLISSAIEIYRNTATSGVISLASFASVVTYTAPGTSISIAAGDVTGDSKPDIILPSNSNFSVSVFQNLSSIGNVVFGTASNFSSSNGNKYAGVGDIDNDGRNDIVVSNSSPVVNVLRNRMGLSYALASTSVSCNGFADGQLNLSAVSLNTVGIVWSNASTNFLLNSLVAGIYSYTLLSGSCIVTESVALIEPAPINLITATSHSVLCDGQTATLSASGATTYSWSTGSGGSSITVTPSVTTSYSVTGTLNGCANTTTISQNISVFDLTANASNTIVCSGEIAILSGGGGLTYTWTGIGSGSTATVSPETTSIYTLTSLNADGCSKTTTVLLEVVNCTGEVNIKSELELGKIYPNPTTGEFYLEFGSDEHGVSKIEIYNSIGQLVKTERFYNSFNKIDLKNEKDGIYVIKHTFLDNKVTYYKIIKSEL